MNSSGIDFAFLSLSSPHVNFGDQLKTNVLARETNEVGAELVSKYPKRFGLLATLPLPDVTASIEEINYSLDVLHADGFTLPTNTQGVYMGQSQLDPVFAELNRRKAVVALHPNKPGAVPEHVNELLPIPLMEFFFDTTRTVINMITKGTIQRFPDIKFIIPHASAVLPVILERLTLVKDTLEKVNILGESDMYTDFRHLYFDLAGKPVPTQLHDLLEIVPEDHLLYGSDYPYTPSQTCIKLKNDLNETELLTATQRQKIYYENALALFPTLLTRLEDPGSN
jgi:6-methylsalicylate decarboxylase